MISFGWGALGSGAQNIKTAARIYVGTDVDLSAPGAILDGETMVLNDRVVLNGQTDATENGVYVWNGAASLMTRAGDASVSAQLYQMIINVEQGTKAETLWQLSNDGIIIIGSTELSFSQLGISYTAGNGIVVGGTTISAKAETLHTSAALDGTLRAVQDWAGTNSPLYLSTAEAALQYVGRTANTAFNGFSLINNTVASASNQQYSPSTIWQGQGWKTDATAASQAVAFRAQVVPVEGAANPTGYWGLDVSINGGAYANKFKVDSTGMVYFGGGNGTLFNSSTDIYTNSVSGRWILRTGGNNAIIIDGSQNIGIGTGSNAGARLEVSATYTATASILSQVKTSGTLTGYVNSGTYYGINHNPTFESGAFTGQAATALFVNANWTTTGGGTWASSSVRRIADFKEASQTYMAVGDFSSLTGGRGILLDSGSDDAGISFANTGIFRARIYQNSAGLNYNGGKFHNFIGAAMSDSRNSDSCYTFGASIALGAGALNPKVYHHYYTINNSGAQTGTATGIFLNATETALNGMAHNLMDLQVGSVSKFKVDNAGSATGYNFFVTNVLRSIGSVDLKLGTSSFGDALTLASATGNATFAGSVNGKRWIGTAKTDTVSAGASTVDCSLGDVHTMTLVNGTPTAITLSNAAVGTYILKLVQDGTGSCTVTWTTTVVWSGGTVPILTTTAGYIDIITLLYDGTTWRGSFTPNFAS